MPCVGECCVKQYKFVDTMKGWWGHPMQLEVIEAQKYLFEVERKMPWKPEYFEVDWEKRIVWGHWEILPTLRTWCWVEMAVVVLDTRRREEDREGETFFLNWLASPEGGQPKRIRTAGEIHSVPTGYVLEKKEEFKYCMEFTYVRVGEQQAVRSSYYNPFVESDW
ncbi:Inactive tyrosine-protein kinase 7 [Frankliniella fusca]|uniref:Inactive tyrosine-protein kinase 7 n=1 Tax=Frankliniella fusca TaxID=407009 RepID=A0AAE1HWA5_9NEOP|nr:Inactive tyrosine-protein kinase 7 [Frankliniella fusca]